MITRTTNDINRFTISMEDLLKIHTQQGLCQLGSLSIATRNRKGVAVLFSTVPLLYSTTTRENVSIPRMYESYIQYSRAVFGMQTNRIAHCLQY
jgi:hypothetical protein